MSDSDGEAGEAPPNDAGQRARWAVRQLELRNAALSAEDRAAKYEKMAESAYAFLRGTNHLYWAELARDPRLARFGGTIETQTWIQGDLHPDNFGAFDDHRGRIVYDLNDFDEALIADYQLDVWRLAVAIALVAGQNQLDARDAEHAVERFAKSYLDRPDENARKATVDADAARGKLRDFLREVEEKESRAAMLAKWTTLGGGTRVLNLECPELAPVDDATRAEIEQAMPAYGESLGGGLRWDPGYFQVKSVARRLGAGIGSLGTPRYYVLVEGPTRSQDDDVILDLKLQDRATGYAYLDPGAQDLCDVAFDCEGRRVAVAHRVMLARADDHVGWVALGERSGTIRARSPYKATFPVHKLRRAGALEDLAEQWGAILARAHARADEALERAVRERTHGERAEFAQLVGEIALQGAARTLADHATFLAKLR